MKNRIRLSALLLGLNVLNIFGMAQDITLISSDGKRISVSKEVAAFFTLPETGPIRPIRADEKTLRKIVDILQQINKQIQMQNAGTLEQEKIIRGEDGNLVAPNVQKIVDTVLQRFNPAVVLDVAKASGVLGMPFLINAAAKVYIDKNPNLQLENLMVNLEKSKVFKNAIPYFIKHFNLKRINAPGELSIRDYIAMYGQPEIKNGRIDLSKKNITNLEGIKLIKNPEQVVTLDLSENKLQTLPDGAFSDFSNLDILFIGANQLSKLPANAFAGLAKLELLGLSDNQLSRLPANIFAGLTKLQWLMLDDNQLKKLSVNVFVGLDNLKKLELWGNQLSRLVNVFAGLTKLELLNLDDNQLKKLPVNVFAGLNNLERLYIRNNELTTLPDNIFVGLTKLKLLDLGNNELTILPVNVFAGLTNLNTLVLKDNKLQTFPNKIFEGLNNLKYIYLSGNPLKESGNTIRSKYFRSNKEIFILIRQAWKEKFSPVPLPLKKPKGIK